MSDAIACECRNMRLQGEYEKAAGTCGRKFRLSEEDAERYLPRDDSQQNLIISKECRIPPLTSVIRYGPDYYVLKKGRVMREGFHRTLPEYRQ